MITPVHGWPVCYFNGALRFSCSHSDLLYFFPVMFSENRQRYNVSEDYPCAVELQTTQHIEQSTSVATTETHSLTNDEGSTDINSNADHANPSPFVSSSASIGDISNEYSTSQTTLSHSTIHSTSTNGPLASLTETTSLDAHIVRTDGGQTATDTSRATSTVSVTYSTEQVTGNHFTTTSTHNASFSTTFMMNTVEYNAKNNTDNLCTCKNGSISDTELLILLEMIKMNLRLDVRSLTKYRRTKMSAPDARVSSAAIGGVGVAVLVIAASLIVIGDIPLLVNAYIKPTYKNTNRFN